MLQKSQGIWLRKFVEARWQSSECESEGRKKREWAREMIAPVRSMERTKDQGARRDARRDFWFPLRSGSSTMIWQIHHCIPPFDPCVHQVEHSKGQRDHTALGRTCRKSIKWMWWQCTVVLYNLNLAPTQCRNHYLGLQNWMPWNSIVLWRPSCKTTLGRFDCESCLCIRVFHREEEEWFEKASLWLHQLDAFAEFSGCLKVQETWQRVSEVGDDPILHTWITSCSQFHHSSWLVSQA